MSEENIRPGMKKAFLLSVFLLFSISCTQKTDMLSGKTMNEKSITSQEALERLIEGNKRYANDQSEHPNRSEERRKEISSKQSPFAVIVGCSDSRVSPEIIFDEGLGDLFVVRVAGNVIGQMQLESIEFSALNLDSVIILVLGHENCGAVDAVFQDNTANIQEIAKFIEPAIQEAKEHEKDNVLEQAVKTNALNMKDFLEKSPNIAKLIQNKKIEVYGAYYNLKTGLVELLDK